MQRYIYKLEAKHKVSMFQDMNEDAFKTTRQSRTQRAETMAIVSEWLKDSDITEITIKKLERVTSVSR